ncbi:MAG: hypothetical protein CM15mP51_07450 [Porticoccaceae bacterium]|nr:MAG: hypothetical protein CM15mP51_07450 [Porticoccaceae bacterium]
MGLVSWKDKAYVDVSGNTLNKRVIVEKYERKVLSGTLIREIEHFDSRRVPGHKK